MRKLKLWLIAILALAIVLPGTYKYIVTTSHVDVIVTNTETKSYTNNGVLDSKYLVFTSVIDKNIGETFEIKDDIFFFNFNSSDKFGMLIRDKKYRLKVQGIRFPFFSWYRNIVKVTPLDTL
jgi:hypothetical protein